MKNLILMACLCLSLAGTSKAQDQIPQTISYQAVARDEQGKVLADQPIGIKVEILQGSANGSVVYSETHATQSNATGTINLLIGGGTPSGSFADIDWGSNSYFLKLSMDTNGGSDYKTVSTTQMMPVPYALYAKKAGEVEKGEESEALPFTIIQDYHSTDLYSILAGEIERSYLSDEYGYENIELECSIIYLNGKDQHLALFFEGYPEGSECENSFKQSSSMGINCDLDLHIPSTTILPYKGTKLVVRNTQTNQIVKEYPFTITLEKTTKQ